MNTLDLSVPSVHCTACQLNIEETLDDLSGITARAVDLDAKRVTVTYDPDVVDPTTITTAIEQAGYPVNA